MMVPDLCDKIAHTLVELPMAGAPLSHTPIELWTAEQVSLWAATVDGGKFSQLALPQHLTGADLISMDVRSLSALFVGTLREARVDYEGSAWVVGTEVDDAEDLSNSRLRMLASAFMASLKRQQLFSFMRSKAVTQV